MKHITKKKKQGYGSGGWIEDYETVDVPMTEIVSESTGIKIRLPGHLGSFTPADIRQAVQWYPKETRQWVNSKKNDFLISDFK